MQYYPSTHRLGRKLAGEANALRDGLIQVLDMVDRDPAPLRPPAAEPALFDTRSTLVRVRDMIKARRKRDRLFVAGLFADPAWDMLLELYAAELCGYRVSISSLCGAAAVPATTALRWVRCLEEKDLVRRCPDANDGRRVFISLSDSAREAMGELMREVQSAASIM